jgi:hypothetical protein
LPDTPITALADASNCRFFFQSGTSALSLIFEQFYALVLGLPWQRLSQMRQITRL